MIHSEEYLNDSRLDWHNKDYLDLIAKRFKFSEYNSVADIGCGLGHWNKLIIPYLKKPAQLYAIDFEPDWLEQCKTDNEFYKQNQCSIKTVCSNAAAINMPDSSVDIVTCQTLLIHTPCILDVLKEFYRITKSGGIAVCCEPNNLITPLLFDRISVNEPAETILNRLQFELAYAAGKEKLGEGKSLGIELIPDLMRQAGFSNIQVYISDKADLYFEEAHSSEFSEIFESEYEKSKKYYLQTGKNLTDFEIYWSNLEKYYRTKNSAAKNERFLTCKPALMYIMYGEKTGNRH